MTMVMASKVVKTRTYWCQTRYSSISSPLVAMASNPIVMASDLIAIASPQELASNLEAMASNLRTMASNLRSDDLQPNSDRLQPNSDGLQPNEITPAKAKNLVYFVGSMTSVPTLQIVLCRITKENQWRERTKTQDKVDIFTWSKCLSNQESFWDLRGLAERWSDRWWAWGIL